eukprot:GEZU01017072.1.p1 GENE.GEZU01017072.1~~GEZU01017072.1.p1  ORF type:complete len:549 (-),score=208.87 GEZU01017072.1:229-1755(-)
MEGLAFTPSALLSTEVYSFDNADINGLLTPNTIACVSRALEEDEVANQQVTLANKKPRLEFADNNAPVKNKPSLTITPPTAHHQAVTIDFPVPTNNDAAEMGFVHLLTDDFSLPSALSPLHRITTPKSATIRDLFSMNAVALAPNNNVSATADHTVPAKAATACPQKLHETPTQFEKKKTKLKKARVSSRETGNKDSAAKATTTTTTEPEEPYVGDFVDDPTRYWTTAFVNKEFIGDGDVEIRSKTRRDTPCLSVPDRLYSSLKYEIRQKAVGSFTTQIPFLLGRLTVLDSVTLQEVKKNNRPVVKGVIESALVHLNPKGKGAQKETPALEGCMKAQFQDVSFHHDRTEFRWAISYFVPTDLENPVLIKHSAAFRVYARKPNNKVVKPNSKKRSRAACEDDSAPDNDEVEENTTTVMAEPAVAAQASTAAAPAPTNNFSLFLAKLNELSQLCNEKLTAEERQICLDMIVAKFLAADSSFPFATTDGAAPFTSTADNNGAALDSTFLLQ